MCRKSHQQAEELQSLTNCLCLAALPLACPHSSACSCGAKAEGRVSNWRIVSRLSGERGCTWCFDPTVMGMGKWQASVSEPRDFV